MKNKHILFTVGGIIVVVVIALLISSSLSKKPQIAFSQVKQADITQAVSADGTVKPVQDLSLSFQAGGTVAEIGVQAGQQVKKGEVLMKLDGKAQAAAESQAQAALAAAQANYQKVVNGATDAQISVSQSAVQAAQTALDNAQKTQQATEAQQNLIVSNALSALLNSGLTATPGASNLSSKAPAISGTYSGAEQGQYNVKIFTTGSGPYFSYDGLETGSAQAYTSGPTPLGSKGLYIQFVPGQIYPNDTWTVSIPNTQSPSYLTNLNAYNAALQSQNQATVSAQAAVDSAQAALAQVQQNLTLQQTPARPEDVAAAKAQVAAAAAQLQVAETNLSNCVLTAPIDGTITSVDVKIGETTQTGTVAPVEVLKMISNDKFEVEAYVSEADIGKVKVGDSAQVTLDAYGPGQPFAAAVINVDPAATVQNGVSTYKVTLQFAQLDDRIKAGMNANAIITDQTHTGSLIIPKTAIITKNNQTFVLVSSGGGRAQETEIQTGLSDLNGNVEVTGGLAAGQEVATFGNQNN
ncbi:MAG TPA: efflux RND transporter periplasmic adaptor subunit [Patescibacteria group bacterium]|nr:efflux RND transporter periplasmic adaptor subunit [Patescibacteria group bacterium]